MDMLASAAASLTMPPVVADTQQDELIVTPKSAPKARYREKQRLYAQDSVGHWCVSVLQKSYLSCLCNPQ
jgi:hypothetical protein